MLELEPTWRLSGDDSSSHFGLFFNEHISESFMMEYAIEVQSVKKTYGSHVVLDNISINIPRGKITTILGFSGAGKSTLLKHLLGITKADEGIIKILGQNIYELNKTELRDFRRNFGMLFQYAALFDSLTSIENVEFPLHEFTSMTPQEISKKAKELLTSVSLEEQSFDKYPSELSGGMRKRVGLLGVGLKSINNAL